METYRQYTIEQAVEHLHNGGAMHIDIDNSRKLCDEIVYSAYNSHTTFNWHERYVVGINKKLYVITLQTTRPTIKLSQISEATPTEQPGVQNDKAEVRESVTHDLKIWSIYFGKVMSGEKRFEIRENDRGFQVGDILRLNEVVVAHDKNLTLTTTPTGRSVEVKVDFVLIGSKFFGVDENYCIMSISPFNPISPKT